jgi:hypothetical protein
MIDAQYYDCVTSDKWVISNLPFVEDFDSVLATEPSPAGEWPQLPRAGAKSSFIAIETY